MRSLTLEDTPSRARIETTDHSVTVGCSRIAAPINTPCVRAEMVAAMATRRVRVKESGLAPHGNNTPSPTSSREGSGAGSKSEKAKNDGNILVGAQAII